MIVTGISLIGLLILGTIVLVGLAPARPPMTLGFAGLVVGVGAVMTLASGSESSIPVVGIVFAVAGLVLGAVAVRRDAASTQVTERDGAPQR